MNFPPFLESNSQRIQSTQGRSIFIVQLGIAFSQKLQSFSGHAYSNMQYKVYFGSFRGYGLSTIDTSSARMGRGPLN